MYSPVGSMRITSGFGPRNGRGVISSNHGGIDFGARSGTTIRAAVPGVVIGAGWNGGYGNLVKVRNVDGTVAYYAHMSRIGTRVGARVNRGTPIGRVGSTGNSTGPHLHFEIRRNGRPVNPKPWLVGDYREVRGGAKLGGLGVGSYGRYKLSSSQIKNARRIIAVGRSMGATQRDLIISLMTAYQESRLQNLNYGDRDSLGLFQQRAGWGSSSQRRNPEYASRKFFSTLFKVRGRNSMSLTGAAQAVQRSAFPNAYAKWEGLARSLMGGQTEFDAEPEPMGEEEMLEEPTPLDGMIPKTPGGGFPTGALRLPGDRGPMADPYDRSPSGLDELRGLLYA